MTVTPRLAALQAQIAARKAADTASAKPGTSATVTPSGKGVLTSTGNFVPFSDWSSATAGQWATVTPSGTWVLTSGWNFISLNKTSPSINPVQPTTLASPMARASAIIKTAKPALSQPSSLQSSWANLSRPTVTTSQTSNGANPTVAPIAPRKEQVKPALTPEDIRTRENTAAIRTGESPNPVTYKEILSKADTMNFAPGSKERRDFIQWEVNKLANKNKPIIQKQNEFFEDTKSNLKTQAELDKEALEKDKQSAIELEQKNKEITDKYFTDIDQQENDYFNQFQDEQNKLMAEWEGSRLNNVRSQIYQSLAARGIDISKVPPEQLIALSGQVWVEAFNDIYRMKENVKNKILAASRDKVSRLNDLKSKKTINDTEYNKALQTVESNANLKVRELDSKFAENILGVTAKSLDQEKADQNANTAALSSIAQAYGLSGEQAGLLAKFNVPGKTAAEITQDFLKAVANPGSDVAKALAENRVKANASENAKLNLEMLKINNEKDYNDAKNQIELARLNGTISNANADNVLKAIEIKAKLSWVGWYAPSSSTSWFNWWTPTWTVPASVPATNQDLLNQLNSILWTLGGGASTPAP